MSKKRNKRYMVEYKEMVIKWYWKKACHTMKQNIWYSIWEYPEVREDISDTSNRMFDNKAAWMS